MLIGIKNASKLIGLSIIACCAVLVCTMFVNFYFDVRLIESEITSELSMVFWFFPRLVEFSVEKFMEQYFCL